LHCPWCSNPENISFEIERYEHDGTENYYGQDYSVEKIYKEIIKDKAFWGSVGGVTFSGGEPLMHMVSILPLLRLLKRENINMAVETSLFAPAGNVISALDLIDYFIVDVKILEPEECAGILGGKLDVYQKNVETVHSRGKLALFRLPLCYEYTFNESTRNILLDFLFHYKDVAVQLFAIHRLGESKYASLGKEGWRGKNVDDKDLNDFCDTLNSKGITAEVITI